jgi:hypothetical protein
VIPLRYEMGFIFQKTTVFIVTAVKITNLTKFHVIYIVDIFLPF